jgi:hypothetical protein
LELEKQRQHAEAQGGEESAVVTTSSAVEALGDHPILGPTICDLGHKRVYITSIERLSSLPVWEKQRFFRHERAKKMARDKAKTLHIGLPGVIGIYEVRNYQSMLVDDLISHPVSLQRNDGSLAIIDGQHRVGE